MSSGEHVCPKCGGKMVKGELKTSFERLGTSSMSPYMSGMPTGGLPSMVEEVASGPYWEERTGEKKGFIFKREETRRMAVAGLRCTICGFIELYAREK